MFTVTELRERLEQFEAKGHGDWPVKVLSGFTIGLDDPDPTEFRKMFEREIVVL